LRRRPNPWIVVPSLAMGVLAAVLGWLVTDVSCRQSGPVDVAESCPGWSVFFSVVSFLVVTVGVAVLLVLVYRSLAEWQERRQSTPP
jgi:H+/Cl- antiporter ClcA